MKNDERIVQYLKIALMIAFGIYFVFRVEKLIRVLEDIKLL